MPSENNDRRKMDVVLIEKLTHIKWCISHYN